MHNDLRIHAKHPQTNRRKMNRKARRGNFVKKKPIKHTNQIFFFFIVNDRYSIRYLEVAAGVASKSWKLLLILLLCRMQQIYHRRGDAERTTWDGPEKQRLQAFSRSVYTTVHKAAVCEWQLIVLSRRHRRCRRRRAVSPRPPREQQTAPGWHCCVRTPTVVLHSSIMIMLYYLVFTVFTFRHTAITAQYRVIYEACSPRFFPLLIDLFKILNFKVSRGITNLFF